MTSRERLCTALRRRQPDRLPCCEQSYWPETLQRWQREGMPADQSPAQLFNLDAFHNFSLDHSLRLPVELLHETSEWYLQRDADGVTHKYWTDHYAPPSAVDYLIKTRDDWERYRDHLAYSPDRLHDGVRQGIRQAHEADEFCTISPGEPVWWVLSTLGMENALMTMALEPDFFVDMMRSLTSLALQLTRQLLSEGVRPDGLLFSSDLCFSNGMLFSPAAYRSLMQDLHREYVQLCREHDLLLILHCDGDVREFVPLLVETGFDCLEPLEARTGTDVRQLKPLYGDRLSFFGNINMDILATGDRDLIRHEVVTKIEAAKPGGGYIHQSDHSVPPTVSYDSYCYWMDLARQHGDY